jgi:hypothetical protein
VPDDAARTSFSRQSDVDSVGFVARALALALHDADLRLELKEAISASSFPEHKIDFQDFIHRSATGRLVRSAAAKAGWDEPRLRGLIERFPSLELYIPVDEQRQTWNGDGDIVVLGTALRDHDVKRQGKTHLTAFDTNGEPVEISMTSIPSQTLVSLVPAEQDFKRLARHRMIAFAECTPETCGDEGGGTGGGTGGGGGGGGGGGIDGWYVDQLRMVYAGHVYDQVAFGHPEFEVWLAACNGASMANMTCTVPVDAAGLAPCGGEDYASSNPRYFNYDDPPAYYSSDFLIAEGNRQLLDDRYAGEVGGIENTGVIIVLEDDEGRCPTTPALDEFGGGGDDWIAHLALHAGQNVMDFSNSSGSDPAKVRVVWAANKTY